MTVVKANLINGIILTVLGLWAGFTSASNTAFIPAVFGIIFLIAHPFMSKENNKVAAHIVVLLTLFALIGFIKPFLGTIERENTVGTLRVGTMILSCVVALIVFIKSFIAARKN